MTFAVYSYDVTGMTSSLSSDLSCVKPIQAIFLSPVFAIFHCDKHNKVMHQERHTKHKMLSFHETLGHMSVTVLQPSAMLGEMPNKLSCC